MDTRFDVSTNSRVLIRLILVTIISILLSVLASILSTALVFGFDPLKVVTVGSLFRFGTVVAAIIPAIICPMLHFKVTMALRARDRAHQELQRIARTDQLTGLLNRRGFDAVAQAMLARPDGDAGSISALMIDIDFFKVINDRFGHDAGDLALVRLANLLRETVIARGFVAGRQGGEEFVALLRGVGGQQAIVIAEDLRARCTEITVENGSQKAAITISVGVASCEYASCSLPDLMISADTALYRAKDNGRNRVVFAQTAETIDRAA